MCFSSDSRVKAFLNTGSSSSSSSCIRLYVSNYISTSEEIYSIHSFISETCVVFSKKGIFCLFKNGSEVHNDESKTLEGLDDELLFRVVGEAIGFENIGIEERLQIGYVDLTCL